jgi:type IV pilus assembly protein PilQ
MRFKLLKLFILFGFLVATLSSCTQSGKFGLKEHRHKTPLIKDDIRKKALLEVEKTVKMGPKPAEADIVKLGKRKQISSEKQRNYLLISDEYKLLKQKVTFKFQSLGYKEAMNIMAEIGEINILVGDEVAGSITAKLTDVPWDKAFNALLDLKNYAADFDVSSNLIRVHSPSNLTQQEATKSARASAVKKKVELEDSIEPIISEIFRLYYISPADAKTTLTDLFKSTTGNDGYVSISITEEKTTRSIIVRGKEKDLDVVDKILKEIDIRTKQVLIEAFIVEANSDFERALGTRLGGYYKRRGNLIGGVQGSSTGAAGIGSSTAALSSGTDSLTDFTAAGRTSGIGIIRSTGSAILKAEITALESLGMAKTISNPKIFTLDNQVATLTQGEEIPYASSSSDGSDTSFKEAALKMTVTPSIIGDGNVLLDIKINNDTPNRSNPGDPAIYKMEISTKLLVADGDIVVIGGIKKNSVSNAQSQTPGVGDLPIVGNLFKGKANTDTLDELLVFIAPRIL